jgi:glyceraldehyde 3-phosphate dehydrogenase
MPYAGLLSLHLQLPLDASSVDMVLECTGAFLNRATLQSYFDKGIKKVVVSAPVKDPEPVLNVVMGCNHELYDPAKDHIITAASCTTNCLAPVVKVCSNRMPLLLKLLLLGTGWCTAVTGWSSGGQALTE